MLVPTRKPGASKKRRRSRGATRKAEESEKEKWAGEEDKGQEAEQQQLNIAAAQLKL